MKKEFPLIDSSDIVYLDSAATTQKPITVINSLNEFYNKYNANAGRGAYKLSIKSDNILNNSRKKVAQFINSENSNQIIFTKNATESSNLIAYSYGINNLKEDDEVVLSIAEHHAVLVPWQNITKLTKSKLKYMYLDNYNINKEEIIAKITDKTKIVCITHISNVLGVVNDIKYIIDYAHSKGAIVIVDASQSIAHKKIDVTELNVDFLFFPGHKMYGPLGVGVLYGKEELLNNMNPFLLGGDMIEYVYEDYTTYKPLPNKFEAGTQNIEAIYGLGVAIDYINKIGYDTIIKNDKLLANYCLEELRKLNYVDIYLPKENYTSIIPFNIKGVHSHDVASILDSENICIRVGDHCAQPLIRFLGLDSVCRVSFNIYNTKEDIDKLILGIKKVAKIFNRIIDEEVKNGGFK